MSFSRNDANGVVLWMGYPNCQAAHDAILMWLRNHCSSFLSIQTEVTRAVKGNLGESIAFYVAHQYIFNAYHAFAANALNPLSKISRPGIDIVWIHFNGTSGKDVAVLQEVKTTDDLTLSLADNLIKDYDKLFGTNPAFTLHTRLQAIKNEIEYKLKQPDLCPRISELAGQSPQTSPHVRLLPTLVHERNGSDPRMKMIAIRTTLCSKG